MRLLLASVRYIEYNTELDAKNVKCNTAFHLACMYDQSKIGDMLIQNSIKDDLTAKNRYGKTGFQFAVHKGGTEEKMLIEYCSLIFTFLNIVSSLPNKCQNLFAIVLIRYKCFESK